MSIDIIKLDKIKSKGTWQVVLGVLMVIWNIMMMMTETESDDVSTLVGVFLFELAFLIWGVFIARSGLRKRKVPALFTEYYSVLQFKQIALDRNFEAISVQMQKPLKTVMKDINLLVKHGVWDDIHGGAHGVQSNNMEKVKANIASKKVLTCDSCGGITEVDLRDSDMRCQFCNTTLREELARHI